MLQLRTLFISILISAVSSVVNAQGYTTRILVDSMETQNVSRRRALYTDDSITVLIEVRLKKGYLVKFGHCCREAKRIEITETIDTDLGLGKLVRSEQMGDNIVLFYSGTDASGWFLYGLRFDIHTMQQIGEPVQLTHSLPFSAPDIELSADHSKVLVHHEALNKRGTVINVEVYSEELNLVWSKKNYIHPDASGWGSNYIVNSNGDVAYWNVQKINEATLNLPGSKDIRCWTINMFSDQGQTYTPYFFTYGSKIILDRQMYFNAQGKPMIVVYYRHKKSMEYGIFIAEPAERNTARVNFYRFADDFVKSSLCDRDRDRYDKGDVVFACYLNSFQIADVIAGSDNSIYVVGEVRNYIVGDDLRYSFNYGSGLTKSYAKVNSEIIVTKIDSVGKLWWNNRIVRAVLNDFNYTATSGVRCFGFDNNLAVLVNDHPENSVLRSPEDPVPVTQNADGMRCGAMFVFDRDGQLTKTEFRDEGNNPVILDLSQSCITGARSITLFSIAPGCIALKQFAAQ